MAPSLRRLWKMYEELLVEDGASRRDQLLSQAAFYAGARGVLKVLGYVAERGDADELERVVRRHARTIRSLKDWNPGSGAIKQGEAQPHDVRC